MCQERPNISHEKKTVRKKEFFVYTFCFIDALERPIDITHYSGDALGRRSTIITY